MSRTTVIALCLAVVSCTTVPEESSPNTPTRRVSKHDQRTLTKRVERIHRSACKCADKECAEQAISHLYAFARRYSGIKLDEESTLNLLRFTDLTIACVRPFLALD